MSDQLVAETSTYTTHNIHNRQTSMSPVGIRTRNPKRREATDLRLRPRGHWDRLFKIILDFIQDTFKFVEKIRYISKERHFYVMCGRIEACLLIGVELVALSRLISSFESLLSKNLKIKIYRTTIFLLFFMAVKHVLSH